MIAFDNCKVLVKILAFLLHLDYNCWVSVLRLVLFFARQCICNHVTEI